MSGRIPQHFIDDLIARADIVEVLGRRLQLKKAGREYKAVCPFHDEKTPSFTVSPQKGFYHCFGCGAHGTALGFLMEYDHLSFPDAVEALAGQLGLEVPREGGERPARRFDDLYDMLARAERYFQGALRDDDAAVEYLKNRGIDGATAKRFGIGYAPHGWSNLLDRYGRSPEEIERLLACGLVIRKDSGQHYDRFRERLMFPIRDARGRAIGFGGRVLGDGEPKYLNSPETALFHKGRELYGLYEARQAIRNIERLVVVEGYMDVVGLARHGIDFAVATLGTATTADHLGRLFRLTDNVFFCFDGDRAGRQAAWRALDTALPNLEGARQLRFVFLPEGQDPDSLVQDQGSSGFESALDEGVPLFEFLVHGLTEGVTTNSIDDRLRFAEKAKPLVDKIPPGSARDLLLPKLAEKVGVTQAKLESWLADPESIRRAIDGAGTKTRTAYQPRLKTRKRSIVRIAIRLVIHFPQAALKVHPGDLEKIDRRGVDLLQSLIEDVHDSPDINSAVLLERYRSSPDYQNLVNLLRDEMVVPDEYDVESELTECIRKMQSEQARNHHEFLIKKEQLGVLSESEKEELRNYRRASGTDG